MPSFKISQLSELTSADDADFFEIVDDSELTISDKNKRITFENLKLSIYTDSRIDTAFPAWNVATTYDSADNPQYVSYQSRLYQFTKSSGTDTGTTPGTDATVWAAVGGVKFFAPPATDAEAAAKTATNRYLTPANLAGSGVVDTLYSIDGSLSSNRTVTLGTYTLDINLDSTGTFAIQDAGTDVFTVNADGSFSLGLGANALDNDSVVIGRQAGTATMGSDLIAIGAGFSMSAYTFGNGSVSIGYQAVGHGIGSVSVGDLAGKTSGTTAGSNGTVLIGRSAGRGSSGTANIAIESIGIGYLTEISGSRAVTIGSVAKVSSASGIAIGDAATTTHNYSATIGRQTSTTETYQTVLGGYKVNLGANPNNTSAITASLQNSNIASGQTNTASGSFTIQSGQSTGSADGGNLIFKVSDGGASGTAQNSQSTVFELGASKIGMYGVTPTTRATTGIGAATFTANTSGISDDTATWGGYTIGQVVQALQTIGILT